MQNKITENEQINKKQISDKMLEQSSEPTQKNSSVTAKNKTNIYFLGGIGLLVMVVGLIVYWLYHFNQSYQQNINELNQDINKVLESNKSINNEIQQSINLVSENTTNIQNQNEFITKLVEQINLLDSTQSALREQQDKNTAKITGNIKELQINEAIQKLKIANQFWLLRADSDLILPLLDQAYKVIKSEEKLFNLAFSIKEDILFVSQYSEKNLIVLRKKIESLIQDSHGRIDKIVKEFKQTIQSDKKSEKPNINENASFKEKAEHYISGIFESAFSVKDMNKLKLNLLEDSSLEHFYNLMMDLFEQRIKLDLQRRDKKSIKISIKELNYFMQEYLDAKDSDAIAQKIQIIKENLDLLPDGFNKLKNEIQLEAITSRIQEKNSSSPSNQNLDKESTRSGTTQKSKIKTITK